ncbi:MAG: HEPN domain-containing protein [Candidatus Zixiibacteriota bacterium]
MADIEIVQEWLEKAEEDFEFALVNLQERKPFYAQICFHFHQAAEKYLKVYIIAHDLEFRKIHDLSMPLKICLSEDSTFEQLRQACEYLNAFYVEARYPVQWPTNFSYEEAQRALRCAEGIRSLVEEKLS